MGLRDSRNALWILRRDDGLDVEGFKSEADAIEHLVRCALTYATDVAASKDALRQAFESGMTHLDEPEEG